MYPLSESAAAKRPINNGRLIAKHLASSNGGSVITKVQQGLYVVWIPGYIVFVCHARHGIDHLALCTYRYPAKQYQCLLYGPVTDAAIKKVQSQGLQIRGPL